MDESSKNPSDSAPNRPNAWTPEDWKNLVEAVKPLVQEWIQHEKNKAEWKQRHLITATKHNRTITYSLIVFLLGLTALMGGLTYFGKVSGDALLFLAGTITGYLIIMIQNLTFPIEEETPEI